ncbi:MAG: T9SS type A sorting domain-containing protein [Chitinophagales bacterium]
MNKTILRVSFLFAFVFSFLGNILNAQVASYVFSQSSTTYTPITGGTVAASGTIDDTSYPALPIGFSFTFNGIAYTTFSLNANGAIALGSTISYSYTPISDGFASNNAIAAYGDDLQGLSNGEMRYQTIGSAPNRTLVMQFSHWRHYNTTGDDLNFQIRLNETSNTVQIVYGSFLKNTTVQTMEVGLRGGSTADYNNRSSATDWAATTAGVANNSSITATNLIIPSSGLTFTWTPPSCIAPAGLSFNGLSSSSAAVSWTNLPTGTPTNGFDWQIVPGGNAQGVGVIDGGNTLNSIDTAIGLTSNTSYTLYVRSNCGGVQSGYTAYTFFFCGTTAPGNGLANAILATTPTFTYNFSASNWPCYNNNYTTRAPIDVFFKFIADSCASSITVSTCNTATSWDNYLTILASNGTTVVGTADDVCGALGSYTFTPSAGATYYAVVEPYSTFTTPSAFTLDITQTTGSPASTLTMTPTNTSCPGGSDGAVTVSALGGKLPFTFTWSNGFTQTVNTTSSTISGLASGTYTVTVLNGCGGTSTATGTVSSAFSFTGVATPTSCNGTSDGAVNLTLTGAVSPTYVWSNGAVTEDITGLAAGTYTVTINSGSCVATASYTVTQPPLGIAAVSDSITCAGSTVSLSLSGQNAGSPFVWQSSVDGISGWSAIPGGNVTPFQVTPSDTTYYRAFFCGTTPTNVVAVNAFVVSNPTVTPVTRCGPGLVTLNATGNDIHWFSSPSSTLSLYSGASYTLNVDSTTTFYAEASGGGTTSNIGPIDNSIGTGAQQQSTNYLIFNAFTAFTLQSVVVYPSTTGNVVIDLTNSSGTVLQSLTYNITTLPSSGGVTVPLNFSVPVGTDLHLAQGAGSISMFRNDGGVTYPYTLPGYASITNSAAGTSYYYFFYNWSISTACSSSRVPVTVTVTPAPAITLAAVSPAVCSGNSTVINATSSDPNYIYTWSPSASLSSATGASVTATPSATTLYNVTASDANTSCQTVGAVSVTVNPLPNVNASSSSSIVCPGTPVTLSGTATNDFVIDAGTVQNTTSTYPAPYGNWYWGAKHQILIRASELAAAGVAPGNISGLSFDIVSTNAVALNGFEIQMAPTALTDLSGGFVATGFSVVAPGTSYAPRVGPNIHNFTTPFNWDGVSNIIVQTCFDNSGYTENAIFNQTATSYVSTAYYRADNSTVCANTTTSGSINQRPNITFITSPTYTYSWTPTGGVTNPDSLTAIASPTGATSYVFKVTNNSTTCFASDTVQVLTFPDTGSFSQTICANEVYTFNGVDLNTPGAYVDTLTSTFGCDSFVTLYLNVLPTATGAFTQTICANEVFTFNGVDLNTAGTYLDTLSAANGCDSVVTLTLNVLPTATGAFTQTICANEVFTFNGVDLNTAGTYLDTLSAANGCDSVVTLTLNVLPTATGAFTQTICANQTYSFNGATLNTAGTYLDTLQAANGCDSVVTLTLVVLPTSTGAFTQTICANQTFTFNGVALSAAGTYLDTLQAANGCDSVVTLTLNVLPTATGSFTKTICANETYTFNGATLNTPGNYLDTLQAANGCDSVVTLTLNVLPTSTGAFTKTICSNETFTFNGATLNTAGTYKDTLTSANGCDSVVTLTLVVNSTKATTLNQSICQGSSFTFNGQTLTAAGTYKDTLTSAAGCDSVITLNLTVNPLPAKPVVTQAGNVLTCSVTASAYQWSLNASTISGATGKQYTITQSGPYTVQVTDANGCKNTSDVFNGIVTAIENIDGTSFDCSVYPNPNNGKFTVFVSNDKASDVQITCHNVIGEIVYTGDFQMNNGQLKTELDLTAVAKGVYIVNVKANGKTTYRKITIAE